MLRNRILMLCSIQLLNFSLISFAFAGSDDVRVSGFVRAAGAALLGDAPDYLGRIDRDGDAGETQLGINLHADLGSGYQVAGQLWGAGVEGEPAEGSGPAVDRFHMAIDWAFVSKHFNNSFSVSAGKIKYPNLLLSDHVDIGLAYPWVRPPEELYSFETEGPYISLESFEGGSVFYTREVADAEISMQGYAGQSIVEDGHLERMLGVTAVWAADNYQIRFGHNQHMMDTVGVERGALNGVTANVSNVGVNAQVANIILFTEYATGAAESDKVTAYYGTLGYQYGKLLPHVTYADVENSEGWGQSSITVGLKYLLIPSASLKFEAKNIKPKKVDELSESGGFFVTGLEAGAESVNLLSVALDVVF